MQQPAQREWTPLETKASCQRKNPKLSLCGSVGFDQLMETAADEKILNQVPVVESTFFDRSLSFFTCKSCIECSAHLCLTGIGHGAMVLTKRHHFFIF
jgi:hypothetical protein